MNARKLAITLLSAVVGGGIFATATLVDLRKEPDIGAVVESFYGQHQNGIEIARQSNLTLIAFNVKESADRKAMGRLMRLWSNDSSELVEGKSIIGDPQGEMAENPARLTITFGYGYSLFQKLNMESEWPIPQNEIPPYPIDQLEDRWSKGDVIVQISGDNPQSIFHAALVIKRDAEPFADVKWQQRGFLDPAGINVDGTSRNLMGQIDGTANKAIGSPEFKEIAWGDGDGGTTMVVRRIRINIHAWDTLSTKNKGIVLGRELESGEKIESKSATSHVSRAFTNGTAGIIRRGFNYDDNYLADGTRDAGLIFISFQAKLKSYLDIQAKLNEVDDLNRWTTPIGSALFYIPAGATSGKYVGQSFFK